MSILPMKKKCPECGAVIKHNPSVGKPCLMCPKCKAFLGGSEKITEEEAKQISAQIKRMLRDGK